MFVKTMNEKYRAKDIDKTTSVANFAYQIINVKNKGIVAKNVVIAAEIILIPSSVNES